MPLKSIAAFVFAAVMAVPAFAQEADAPAAETATERFYVELGSDVDEAGAEQQWNQLLRTHK